MRQLVRPVVLVAAFLALAVGCGGSKASSNGGAGAATVKLGGSTLGKFLVDDKGRTLYLFEADKAGKSTCSGTCAVTWPPLTVASPRGGDGLDSGALATTKRGDATQQVTYHGHPLYRYAGDGTTAGTTKGEALNTFGGLWYVVDSGGKAVQPGSASGMGSGGGGGYGY